MKNDCGFMISKQNGIFFGEDMIMPNSVWKKATISVGSPLIDFGGREGVIKLLTTE